MGPQWPGHSPPRETTESSPGVSPVPSECGLEPKGVDRSNPMVGFPRLQAREEVNHGTGFRRKGWRFVHVDLGVAGSTFMELFQTITGKKSIRIG